MQDLTQSNYFQRSLGNYTSIEDLKKGEILIKTIDSINRKFKTGAITWGITQRSLEWKMNKNLLSDTSTTDIKKIPIIII